MKIHPLTFFLCILAVMVAAILPCLEKAKRSANKSKAISDLKQISIYLRDLNLHQPDRDHPEEFLEQYFNSMEEYKGKISDSPSLPHPPSSPALSTSRSYRISHLIPENGTGSKPNQDKLPNLVSHMIPGTRKFDREIFRNEAVYSRNDSSVASCRVDKTGKALLRGQGRVGILDNGPETLWGDWEPGIYHDPNWKKPSPMGIDFRSPLVIAYLIEATIAIYLLIRIILTIIRRKAT